MTTAAATRTVQVSAPAEAVYRLVTDLPAFAALAEETSRIRWTNGSTSATQGATFRGSNRHGWRRWSTTCTVTDAEPGRRFAFEVRLTMVPIARWQYDIEATADGCAVTESTWDRRPGWLKPLGGLATGVADRASVNGAHIEATLARLKDAAERAAG